MAPFKLNWDMLMMALVLYSCTTSPAQIALYESGELGLTWNIINWIIDAFFLIDIILTFNTAILNDEYEIILDRCEIAKDYLNFWFWVDLIAILPFDLIFSAGGTAQLIRFLRLGRIAKILKLLKLMRLLRIQKTNSFSLQRWLMNLANISPDYKWVASFMGYFIMTTHVVCCCWIICARIDPDTENSWIAGYEESSRR